MISIFHELITTVVVSEPSLSGVSGVKLFLLSRAEHLGHSHTASAMRRPALRRADDRES
jgi:hypothetical protein